MGLDEEDSLAHELEKEQEDALESAIKEEETWLQELEREQNMEIIVETEPETEVEGDLDQSVVRAGLEFTDQL